MCILNLYIRIFSYCSLIAFTSTWAFCIVGEPLRQIPTPLQRDRDLDVPSPSLLQQGRHSPLPKWARGRKYWQNFTEFFFQNWFLMFCALLGDNSDLLCQELTSNNYELAQPGKTLIGNFEIFGIYVLTKKVSMCSILTYRLLAYRAVGWGVVTSDYWEALVYIYMYRNCCCMRVAY